MKDSLCLVVNRSTSGCRITDSWVCSDVLITLIICITILLIVGCIAYCYYNTSGAIKIVLSYIRV